MKKFGILFVALLALTGVSFGDTVGKATTLKTRPIVETTAQIMARERAYGPKLPIRKIKAYEEENEFDFSRLPSNPRSPRSATWPPFINDAPISVKGGDNGAGEAPLFGVPVDFGGPTSGESGFVPPDSDGDVSPSSVIVCANGRMKSYDRLGNLTVLNVSGNTFFSSVRTAGQNVSDPRVAYDRISKRWFLEIIDVLSTNNRICLAVSDKEVIDGTTVWTFFQFAQNVGGGASGFCDYATLGVDANGVYIGSNRFNGSFKNCDLFAIDKASLLAGTLTVTPFRDLISVSNAGIFTPWPCTNDDPAATVAFIIGSDAGFTGTLDYRRVTFSAGTFSISANGAITVPTNSSPLSMPISTSASSTGSVSALDLRLFYGRVFRNRLTGAVTVHTAQGSRMDASGVGSGSGDRSGARWYNIGNVFSGTAALTAAGTVVDSSATPRYCTIPSTAMNGQGHQFIGFSMGNTGLSPSVGGSYRLAGDPLVTTPTLIDTGANYYNLQSGTPTGKRWGDYSFTMVDPRDMMSIWTFQEYCNANNSWQVRALKILAPAPTVASFAPSSAIQGQTTNVTVTGTGIFDPDSTYPDHLAFSFGPNVTVNTVTWSNATTATVNITVSLTAALGASTVTLTNPDGQTATGSFTINPNPKPVSGTLALQGYVGSIASLQFIYEIRDASTNALIETQTITGLGAGNTFTLNTTQSAGTYNLRIRGVNRFLAKNLVMTLTTTGVSGLSYSLLNGDADGNNVVAIADFNILKAAWGGIVPGAPYNEAADFDGNGVIAVADFNILRANWGAIGDN